MIKFLPSYVGSKSYWVERLQQYKGRRFIEPFCGSAVLSVNLASSCVLNDLDPYIFNIMSKFDEMIVPEVFTPEDYFKARPLKDWWKYAYCLQKMSYSGVFRYSKNGYNVPLKTKEPVYLTEDYRKSLDRWNELKPEVYNTEYYNITHHIKPDDVLVLDPPYQNTVASYNKDTFDYQFYWEYVRLNEHSAKTVIIFDFIDNLPFPAVDTRKSRVNGGRMGNTEGYHVFEDSKKAGEKGELIFYEKLKHKLEYINNPHLPDFRCLSDGSYLELKSDYYDLDKTKNFFFERYSNNQKKTPGGPWQALEKDAKHFTYFFVKNSKVFTFETKELVEFLDANLNNYKGFDVPNPEYTTYGYTVPRDDLKHLYKTFSI